MSSHVHLQAGRRRLAATLILSLVFASCGQSVVSTTSAPTESAVAGSSPSATGSVSPRACSPNDGPTVERKRWSDRIFYEIFVRSFQDSDGDGIGDLRGLTSRLDELNDGDPSTTEDLGVTGLWLMPIAESPSYHGYDVVDYRAVESDYGTADDFRALIAAAHERGIVVIVDLVLNHTSRDHPWFQDARTPGSVHDDWYVWAESRPAVARSDGSRVWHEAGGRYYYGYFWEGMPDLNLENPEVTAELDDIGRFWLEEMGVDGFRLDAARHLIEDGKKLENTPETFEWLKAFRERLKAGHPEAIVLGEVWDATSMSSRYVRDGALDLTFDFGLASATIISLNSRDAGSVAAALREVAKAYPRDTLATFLTNHDQNRVIGQLGDDPAAARLAATLLLTGPGAPFIYYGEEIGMSGSKPDERIRTPMRWDATEPAAGFSTATPWEALSDDPASLNVADESADPDSLLATYRDLIRLRALRPALASGDLVPVDSSDRRVVAFVRNAGTDAVLVVANVGNEAVSSPILTLDEGPLCGTPSAVVVWGDGQVAAPTVTPSGGFEDYAPVATLGAREAIVIDLRP